MMDAANFQRLVLGLLMGVAHGQHEQEPTCMSRFDYEHKMLHSIVKMEIEQKAQQEHIERLRKELEKENADLKDEILQLQKTAASQELSIKTLAGENHELQSNLTTHCKQQCKPGAELGEGYTYRDYLAQSTCVALGVRYVSAVRRTCSGSSGDCASVCRSVGKTCINSLHVYARKNIKGSDVGKEGLVMYRYNACGGGCGPNYCCCQK